MIPTFDTRGESLFSQFEAGSKLYVKSVETWGDGFGGTSFEIRGSVIEPPIVAEVKAVQSGYSKGLLSPLEWAEKRSAEYGDRNWNACLDGFVAHQLKMQEAAFLSACQKSTEPKQEKITMKNPNQNPVVQELARELVAAHVAETKALEACNIASFEAVEAAEKFDDADNESRRLAEEAAAIGEALKDSARAYSRAATKALNEREEELRVAKGSGHAAKQGLEVARAAASEDIELLIGSSFVSVHEVSGDRKSGYRATVTTPAKVKKTA